MTPEDERAAIVAWLRDGAERMTNDMQTAAAYSSYESAAHFERAIKRDRLIADEIERAEHHRQDGGDDGE